MTIKSTLKTLAVVGAGAGICAAAALLMNLQQLETKVRYANCGRFGALVS